LAVIQQDLLSSEVSLELTAQTIVSIKEKVIKVKMSTKNTKQDWDNLTTIANAFADETYLIDIKKALKKINNLLPKGCRYKLFCEERVIKS